MSRTPRFPPHVQSDPASAARLAGLFAELAAIANSLDAEATAQGLKEKVGAEEHARMKSAVALMNRWAIISRVMMTLSLLGAWLKAGNRPLRRGAAALARPFVRPIGRAAAVPIAGENDEDDDDEAAILRDFAGRPIEDILDELRADLAEAVRPPVGDRRIARTVARLQDALAEVEAAVAKLPPETQAAAVLSRPAQAFRGVGVGVGAEGVRDRASHRARLLRGGSALPLPPCRPGGGAFRG